MAIEFASLDDDGLGRRLRALGSNAALGSSPFVGTGPTIVDGEIVLDSKAGGLDAMRSAGTLEQRQIVVQAGEITIVVDLAPEADGCRVTGQTFGIDLPVAVQFIDLAGEEVGLVVTDDFGEFEALVPHGELSMIIASGRTEVIVALPTSG